MSARVNVTSSNTGSADPSEPAVVIFEQRRRGSLERLQRAVQTSPTIISVFILLATIVAFGLIVGPRFFTPFNFSLIVQQVTVISVLGAAQTLVILTAGIDLSVGALMVLCSVVMGRTAVDAGVPQDLAIALAFAVGGLAGLVNGILVTYAELPPFITTLGTWNVFLALTLWYSQSQTIVAQDIATRAPLLQFFGHATTVGGARITAGTVLMLSLYALLWYVLNKTAWGRHVHAIGDDREAARLAGINVKKTLLSVWIVAGLICALAGWVLVGRIGSITPQEGQTANLDSITAVVVGGTSLFGGRGSLLGTLNGALIVGIFRNGLALARVDSLWQNFAIGLLIIIAVTIDQRIRKLSS